MIQASPRSAVAPDPSPLPASGEKEGPAKREGEGHRVPASVELEVCGLTKRYSPQVSVGPIWFEVQEGEFFSLLGPSGCGKTTTLRCIAGFEELTEDSISLHGERIDGKPPHRRDIGLVFQNYALFPHLTV